MSEIAYPTVHIVGPSRTINELMASYFKREANINCHVSEGRRQIELASSNGHKDPRIILWDCQGADQDWILNEYSEHFQDDLSQEIVAFFNVRPDIGLEEAAIAMGVWGLFYENDSMETILKGVRVISEGELWVSRQFLTQYVLHQKPCNINKLSKNPEKITDREAEILRLIQSGATNAQIAEALCISPYTVRTHVYNLFKKIGAANRLQAAIWAADNL